MVSTGLEHAAVNGLVTGSFIALGAIGLSLVYNIAGVPNFAHGELLMLGAYAALFVNLPQNVPLFGSFTAGPQELTPVGQAILFGLTIAGVLAIIYQLGGQAALAGSWWPVDISAGIAVAVHGLAAAGLGAAVVVGAPSILASIAFAAVVVAAISPLFDKYIFRQFRETGAQLATLLIAALGLAFALRFGIQAVFGGENQGPYTVPSTIGVAGSQIPLSPNVYFDYYFSGGGAVLEVTNTGPDPNTMIALWSYSWPVLGVVFGSTVVLSYLSYRWRGRGLTETDTVQTISPRLVGGAVGVVSFAALLIGFGVSSSGTVPTTTIYESRIRTSVQRAGLIVLAVVLMTGLHVLLQETKFGKAMRAASDNLDLAKVTGINTGRVMKGTWVIAGAYAAVGGVMIGVLFFQIVPSMGFFRLLPIFAAAILGGLASVYGAIIGSFAVGLAMEVGFFTLNEFISVGDPHRISLAFVLLFIVLLIRPEGITGGR